MIGICSLKSYKTLSKLVKQKFWTFPSSYWAGSLLWRKKHEVRLSKIFIFNFFRDRHVWNLLVCFRKKIAFFLKHFYSLSWWFSWKKSLFEKWKKICQKSLKKHVFLLIWGRKGLSVNPPFLKDPFLSIFIR